MRQNEILIEAHVSQFRPTDQSVRGENRGRNAFVAVDPGNYVHFDISRWPYEGSHG